MLNPSQIRSRRFSSTARGTYRSEEVDAFVEEVAVSYEQMFQENAELVKRLNQLAERVDEYRKDEDSIRAAILTSQKVADQITREAQQSALEKTQQADAYYEEMVSKARDEAQETIDSAQRKADGIVAEAQMKAQLAEKEARQQAEELLQSAKKESADTIERIADEIRTETITLDMIKKDAASFKEELITQYKRHIAFVEELPAVVAGMTQQDERPVQNEEPLTEGGITAEDTTAEEAQPYQQQPGEAGEPAAQEEPDIFAAMKAKAMSEPSADEAAFGADELPASAEEAEDTEASGADAAEREAAAEAAFATEMYDETFGEQAVRQETPDDAAQTIADSAQPVDESESDEEDDLRADNGLETDEDETDIDESEDEDIDEDDTDGDEDADEDDLDTEDEDIDEDDADGEDEDADEDDLDTEDEDIDEDDTDGEDEYADEDDLDGDDEDIDEDDTDGEDEDMDDDDMDEDDEDDNGEDADDGDTDTAGGFRISLDDFDDDSEPDSRRPSLSDFETVQFDEEEDEDPGDHDGGDSPPPRFRGFFKK